MRRSREEKSCQELSIRIVLQSGQEGWVGLKLIMKSHLGPHARVGLEIACGQLLIELGVVKIVRSKAYVIGMLDNWATAGATQRERESW